MTSRAEPLCIHPIQPTNYDPGQSDYSDSESDSEEWVTVSASSTTSTNSTLPKNLVLRPNADHAATHRTPVQLNKSEPATSSASLKAHLPTLTAIYLMSASSIHQKTRFSTCDDPRMPFSSFASLSGPSPVCLHSPTVNEQYLRICADCARPQTRLYCTGTWSSIPAEPCAMHAAALRKQGSMPGYTKAPGPVTRRGNSACLHGIDQGCKNCDETKDRELFRLVLEAVQPFQRADTENVGIKVFDMTVS